DDGKRSARAVAVVRQCVEVWQPFTVVDEFGKSAPPVTPKAGPGWFSGRGSLAGPRGARRAPCAAEAGESWLTRGTLGSLRDNVTSRRPGEDIRIHSRGRRRASTPV